VSIAAYLVVYYCYRYINYLDPTTAAGATGFSPLGEADFVVPNYLLGSIQDTHMIELVASPQQIKFGPDKGDTLPRNCRQCDVRFASHGECPKNRFLLTPEGEPGLNYLCAGFKAFYHHVDFPMKLMAGMVRRNREATEVMQILDRIFAGDERNATCPCGSQVQAIPR
jgi:uncharacterized protein